MRFACSSFFFFIVVVVVVVVPTSLTPRPYTTVHGLGGTPEDLTYLKETLERRGGPGTLVHLAKCNKGRTKDGVAEGGTRLANEVQM